MSPLRTWPENALARIKTQDITAFNCRILSEFGFELDKLYKIYKGEGCFFLQKPYGGIYQLNSSPNASWFEVVGAFAIKKELVQKNACNFKKNVVD